MIIPVAGNVGMPDKTATLHMVRIVKKLDRCGTADAHRVAQQESRSETLRASNFRRLPVKRNILRKSRSMLFDSIIR
jgi:hypothetical protein